MYTGYLSAEAISWHSLTFQLAIYTPCRHGATFISIWSVFCVKLSQEFTFCIFVLYHWATQSFTCLILHYVQQLLADFVWSPYIQSAQRGFILAFQSSKVVNKVVKMIQTFETVSGEACTIKWYIDWYQISTIFTWFMYSFRYVQAPWPHAAFLFSPKIHCCCHTPTKSSVVYCKQPRFYAGRVNGSVYEWNLLKNTRDTRCLSPERLKEVTLSSAEIEWKCLIGISSNSDSMIMSICIVL